MPALPFAAAQVKVADFGHVAGCQIQPHATHVDALWITAPIKIRNAQRGKKLLRRKVGQRHTNLPGQNGRQQLRIAAVVVKAGARCIGHRAVQNKLHPVFIALHGKERLGQVVVQRLDPVNSRGHVQQVRDVDGLFSGIRVGACQTGEEPQHGFINALQLFLVDGDAGECSNNPFGGGIQAMTHAGLERRVIRLCHNLAKPRDNQAVHVIGCAKIHQSSQGFRVHALRFRAACRPLLGRPDDGKGLGECAWHAAKGQYMKGDGGEPAFEVANVHKPPVNQVAPISTIFAYSDSHCFATDITQELRSIANTKTNAKWPKAFCVTPSRFHIQAANTRISSQLEQPPSRSTASQLPFESHP